MTTALGALTGEERGIAGLFTEPGLVPRVFKADRTALNDLMSLSAFVDLLNAHAGHYGREGFKVFANGQKQQATTPAEILAHIAQGASVIFDDAQIYCPPLGCFVDALSAEIWANARANIYLSQPGVAAFRAHYDPHTVLVWQVNGQKEWRWWGAEHAVPDAPFWARDHGNPMPPETPDFTHVLRPGEVLLMPKGYWHGATCVGDQASLHITFGLFLPTMVDFTAWLTTTMSDVPEERRTMPVCPPEKLLDGQGNEGWIDVIGNVFERIGGKSAIRNELAARFVRSRSSNAFNHTPFTTYLLAGEKEKISLGTRLRVVRHWWHVAPVDQGWEIVGYGEQVRCPEAKALAFKKMLDLKVFTAEEIPESGHGIIPHLLERGILDVV